MESRLYQVFVFLIACSLECLEAPQVYGALRLAEGAAQIVFCAKDLNLLQNEALLRIAERIEQKKGTALTDRAQFHLLIEEIALELV